MSEPPTKRSKFSKSFDRNKKRFYANQRRKRDVLRKGMVGFLLTTDGRDMDACREACSLLEELVKVGGSSEADASSDNVSKSEQPDESNRTASSVEKEPAPRTESAESGVKDNKSVRNPVHTMSAEDGKDGSNTNEPDLPDSVESKPVVSAAKPDETGSDPKSDIDEDIGSNLAKECADLKSRKFRYRFEIVETNVNCVRFISDNEAMENESFPSFTLEKLYKSISDTKSLNSRHVQRLMSVDLTTDVRKGIVGFAEPLGAILRKFVAKLQTAPMSYSVEFKTRNNGILSRDEVIREIGDIVKEVFPLIRVDLTKPDVSVLVNVVQNVVCFGIVRDYFVWKKGNLRLIAEGAK